jgi:hypothetical protein
MEPSTRGDQSKVMTGGGSLKVIIVNIERKDIR